MPHHHTGLVTPQAQLHCAISRCIPTYTGKHALVSMLMLAHTCVHTRARTHTHKHAYTHARVRTHTHTHACTHTRAHAHTCTHTRAHIHSHTRTYTHTRARTLTRSCRLNYIWAMGYNVLMIPLAAGVAYPITRVQLPPWVAGMCMAFSSVSVVLSSLALRGYKRPSLPPLPHEVRACVYMCVCDYMRVACSCAYGIRAEQIVSTGCIGGVHWGAHCVHRVHWGCVHRVCPQGAWGLNALWWQTQAVQGRQLLGCHVGVQEGALAHLTRHAAQITNSLHLVQAYASMATCACICKHGIWVHAYASMASGCMHVQAWHLGARICKHGILCMHMQAWHRGACIYKLGIWVDAYASMASCACICKHGIRVHAYTSLASGWTHMQAWHLVHAYASMASGCMLDPQRARLHQLPAHCSLPLPLRVSARPPLLLSVLSHATRSIHAQTGPASLLSCCYPEAVPSSLLDLCMTSEDTLLSPVLLPSWHTHSLYCPACLVPRLLACWQPQGTTRAWQRCPKCLPAPSHASWEAAPCQRV